MTPTIKRSTRLGDFVLKRMQAMGMEKQADLARAAAVGDSTISRMMTIERFVPDPATTRRLAKALGVDKTEFLLFVYGGLDDEDAPEPVAPHPRAAEITRMLADDSPLTVEDRARLETVLDVVADHFRPKMRKRA